MDTTTNTKSRELPPLNVYVRIRPFIGDELERGENQKLLDILDERRIAVKVYPTINNTIRNLQASYNEYQVTRIFDQDCTQQHLFEQTLEQPTNEIFTGSNWLLCTYGLTNSGKTHTMFGTPDDPGLIPKCLHRIFLNVGENIDEKVFFKPDGLENLMPTSASNLEIEMNVRNYIFKDDKTDRRRMRLPNIVQEQSSFQDFSVQDEHYSVWISFFELYNENILDLLVQPKEMKSRKNLRLMQNDESTMIKNLIQIPVFDIKEAEDIIRFGYSNRSTSKTNLNEASSRSHAVLCITLITISEFDEEPVMSHMYICDLAGNEPSTGTGKQLAETCNINTSLMTFKDCIRTLNENQTAKKQMLIPYRNSVLTSIFRPFFVGRGRILICCNVNPCATFINQTNELLKFCALAQKTVIVQSEAKTAATGLIRAQRKSKQKAPKRLMKDGPLKLKNKPSIILDDEDSTNQSDRVSSSNEKNSINYWKSCAKKALDLLQKHASNRRRFFKDRHEERVKTVEYLLHQREQLESLAKEKQKFVDQCETLANNLRLEQDQHLRTQQLYNDLILQEKQYRQKILKLEKELKEKQLQSRDEVDQVENQMKLLQKRYDQLNNENEKLLEEKKEEKNRLREYDEQYQEEIQRLKRDLGLELYRKQDAEKKARACEEKFRQEQNQWQKVQVDLTKTKHDLKTLQVKYDALQMEMIEMHKNRSRSRISMLDAKTSTNPVETEEERPTRSKRRTNDDHQTEQEVKKPKRVTRSQSRSSSVHSHQIEPTVKISERIPILVQQMKKNSSKDFTNENKVKNRTALIRARPKKATIELVPIPVQERAPSPTYETIDRDPSLDRASFATVAVNASIVAKPTTIETLPTTPKPSTFKRIQSLFRPSPTLSGSAHASRVLQTKSTVIAFGSSTPTSRIPTTLKPVTPASTLPTTPSASMVKKGPSPKGKYNLRTRLFANSTNTHDKESTTDEDEKKSRIKKPQRTRK